MDPSVVGLLVGFIRMSFGNPEAKDLKEKKEKTHTTGFSVAIAVSCSVRNAVGEFQSRSGFLYSQLFVEDAIPHLKHQTLFFLSLLF